MKTNESFEVGDEVITSKGQIGEVVRITPKTRKVVVSFGHYEESFYPDGTSIGTDIWSHSHIMHMTPEIRKELENRKTIRRCKDVFKRTDLSVKQAEKILEILEQP